MRWIFAVFFAAVLFAEWGSHSIILSQEYSSGGGQSMTTSERGHDDPCSTLICSDGQRKDQGFKFSHESSQHNAFFQPPSKSEGALEVSTDHISRFSIVFEIFRPPDPAFHPPELS